MYLMRLEMRGFKSFVEAQVSFQPGSRPSSGRTGLARATSSMRSLGPGRAEHPRPCAANGWRTLSSTGPRPAASGMTEVSLILGDVDGTSHGNGNGDGEAAPLHLRSGMSRGDGDAPAVPRRRERVLHQ